MIRRKERGITLINLVITVAITIILAGIIINTITSNSGLINTIKRAKQNQELAQQQGQEKIDQLKAQQSYIEDGVIEKNDSNSPTINSIKISDIKNNSFTVNLNVTETETGLKKVEYSCKNGTDGTFVENDYNSKSTSYTFTNLDSNTIYCISTKVIDNNDNYSTAETITATLPEISTPTIPQDYTKIDGDKNSGIVIKDLVGNEWVWVPTNRAILDASFCNDTNEINQLIAKLSDNYNPIIIKLKNNNYEGQGYNFSSDKIEKIDHQNTPSSSNREPDTITNTTSGTDSTLGTTLDGDTTNLGKVLIGNYASNKTAASFKAQLQEEYNNFALSIKKYGGFYIGRYELSGTVTQPLVQKGKSPLVNTNWYDFYVSAKTLKNNNAAVTTEMIRGCEWDRTLMWLYESGNKSLSELYDSASWGNYKNNSTSGAGQMQVTGYSELWKANNIYDLAGNSDEWTQEANDGDKRIFRGGNFNFNSQDRSVSQRDSATPSYSSDASTSRAVLYINP